MAFRGPVLDPRRGDTVQAYIVCVRSQVDYQTEVTYPMWSAYVSREQYKDGGPAIVDGVPMNFFFGSAEPTPPFASGSVKIDKSKSELAQIYSEAKKLPKAKDFSDVIEEGQVPASNK